MSEKPEASELKKMITSMADAFSAERKKEEPYKELFKSGSTYTGLLSELEFKMTGHVLDACDVLSERHYIKMNKAQLRFLMALPFLVEMAEENAQVNEGRACSVDKAFFILSEQFKGLSNG